MPGEVGKERQLPAAGGKFPVPASIFLPWFLVAVDCGEVHLALLSRSSGCAANGFHEFVFLSAVCFAVEEFFHFMPGLEHKFIPVVQNVRNKHEVIVVQFRMPFAGTACGGGGAADVAGPVGGTRYPASLRLPSPHLRCYAETGRRGRLCTIYYLESERASRENIGPYSGFGLYGLIFGYAVFTRY